ncbi:MAG TPA: hypothetical protein VMS18_30750 [Candidatus Binatia bacterium]|nr:hypothetical protein [Candidatus Binatia bacterium]
MLQSKLLSTNQRLRDCEINDPAHVTPGDQGEFVKLIQQALILIEDMFIEPAELNAGMYGPSTADAVLQYKTERNIVNRAYQSQPDNIIGKMTIKSLDNDLLELEGPDGPFTAAAVRPMFGRLT